MSEDRGGVDEFELIERYFKPLAALSPAGLGLADDAALLDVDADTEQVISIDGLVEGVHFPPADPEAAAWRALGSSLSDLAAMGAAPRAFLLALALPRHGTLGWLPTFARALRDMATAHQIPLIGGDTIATPGPATVTMTVIGVVPCGEALKRSGGRVGDRIVVTGAIGAAAHGLAALQAGATAGWEAEIERFRKPLPRLAAGVALRGVASAAIDISDGLAQDLGHLARVSGVAAEIEAAAIPVSPRVRRDLDAAPSVAAKEQSGDGAETPDRNAGQARRDSGDTLHKILTGGDDYELVFTLPAARIPMLTQLTAASGCPLTVIGSLVAGRAGDVFMIDGCGRRRVPAHGYRHCWLDDEPAARSETASAKQQDFKT